MGKARKSPKFAVMKKIVTSKAIKQHKEEVLNPNKKDLEKDKLPRNVPNVSSALFFKHNNALGPPYRVLVDTNFVNFSIKNKFNFFHAVKVVMVPSSSRLMALLVLEVLCYDARVSYTALRLCNPSCVVVRCSSGQDGFSSVGVAVLEIYGWLTSLSSWVLVLVVVVRRHMFYSCRWSNRFVVFLTLEVEAQALSALQGLSFWVVELYVVRVRAKCMFKRVQVSGRGHIEISSCGSLGGSTGTPCFTGCVMAELEKLGQKYRTALRIAKDPRFERLPCTHKGTYADDCIVERVTQHKCYMVATCDRDLKRRIRKVPGVPIMYITQHKYSIERLPEATIGGGTVETAMIFLE
ncbi:hypothetical protein RJ639_043624, partial [Escallonia herrerae]